MSSRKSKCKSIFLASVICISLLFALVCIIALFLIGNVFGWPDVMSVACMKWRITWSIMLVAADVMYIGIVVIPILFIVNS